MSQFGAWTPTIISARICQRHGAQYLLRRHSAKVNDTENLDTIVTSATHAVGGNQAPLTVAQRLSLCVRDHWSILGLLVVFLALQACAITVFNDLIFDENYWVPEALRILEREELSHGGYTSLGKLIIASGIGIFGDNPWGWRISSVILGAISMVLFYLIALTLSGKRTAVLASLLLVTHNLFFAFSGLAMLDMSFVAFMLLSFLLYLRKSYALSGLSLALSVLCKPVGILALLAIAGHWYLARRKVEFRTVGPFSVVAIFSFFALMPITDFMATGQWFNPFNRLYTILFLHTAPIYPDDPGVSRPWQWLFVPLVNRTGPDFNYTLMVPPTIWLLTVPSLAYLAYRYFFVRKNRNTPRFVLLWFAATYLVWIPIVLVTGRPTYLHYFLPTVGATCIAIGYVLNMVWNRSETSKNPKSRWGLKSLVIVYLILHVLIFLIISPLPYGLTS